MNLILKILIGIAASVIIAEGVITAHSYYKFWKLEQEFKQRKQDAETPSRGPAEPAQLIPLITESYVTTSLDYIRLGEASDVELNQETPIGKFLFVPLVLKNKDTEIAVPASQEALQTGWPIENFECKNASFPNIIVANRETGEAKAVFQEKIAVTALDTVGVDANGDLTVLISVVRQDSNRDGYLSCHDLEEMSVYQTKDDKVTFVDLGGGEFVGPIKLLKEGKTAFTIGIDSNGDGFFDPSTERTEVAILDHETLTVEKIAPSESYTQTEEMILGKSEPE